MREWERRRAALDHNPDEHQDIRALRRDREFAEYDVHRLARSVGAVDRAVKTFHSEDQQWEEAFERARDAWRRCQKGPRDGRILRRVR